MFKEENSSSDAAIHTAQASDSDVAITASHDTAGLKSSHDNQAGHVDSAVDCVSTGKNPKTLPPADPRDAAGDIEAASVSSSSSENEKGGKHRLDGGLTAWMAVIASFLAHFVVFGLFYSFGIYQKEYATVFPESSDLVRSLSGTVGPSIMFLLGPITGRTAERIGFRRAILLGGLTLSLGIILAGFSTQVWHAVLTQGVVYGVGASLMYFPAVSLPSQWWVDRRSLAIGIAVSGSGVGGLVVNNVSIVLIPQVGLMWTLRIVGFASLALILLTTALVRTRLPPGKDDGSPLVDLALLRNPKVWPMILTGFFMPFGYLLPYYFLPQYVQDLYAQRTLAITLLAIINVLSIFGRIGMGFLADRVGNVNSFLTCIMLAGISMLTFWLPADPSRIALLYVFVCGYGFFGGGFISLLPTVAAQLYGIEKLPSIVGLIYTATVPGTLVGTPIASAIVQAAKNSAAAAANVSATAAATDPEVARSIVNAATAILGPAGQYTPAIVFACACVFAAGVSAGYLRFGILDRRVRARV